MTLRTRHIQQLSQQTFDVLIIGAGINGAVSASALAAKGLKVALIDKGDFAGSTSSNSSNLAWGGIKYLENYEFRLVNELCKSRNHLMASYPSTVKEIRFLTSVQKGFRLPIFILYCGSFLYWLLGRCWTKAPKYLTTKQIHEMERVINTENIQGGFEYSDAYFFDNDARFVFNFIRRAMDEGCIAANYLSAGVGTYQEGIWHVPLRDEVSGETIQVNALSLVNATGPYADKYNESIAEHTEYRHAFSKGVHLIVDRIAAVERVLAFFASDGRLFFVIPMGRKTCIGTTDTPVNTPEASVSEEDRQFVLENANRLLNLRKPLTSEDIIAERCGVRPLAVKGNMEGKEWKQLSRKHIVESNIQRRILSVFGGKLTDCLNLAEEVCERLASFGIESSNAGQNWYGEPDEKIKKDFFRRAKEISLDELTWEKASEPLSQRFWRRYGDKAFAMLDKIEQDPTQAKLLIKNAEYTRCEIEYARDHEMIVKLEDFLRRRSKIAMVLSLKEILQAPGLKHACEIFFADQAEAKLQEYIQEHSTGSD